MILWASIFSRVDSVDEVVVPFCPLEIKEGHALPIYTYRKVSVSPCTVQVTQMAAVITQGHLKPGSYQVEAAVVGAGLQHKPKARQGRSLTLLPPLLSSVTSAKSCILKSLRKC